MTDQHEPQPPAEPVPDPGMPLAGRPPAAPVGEGPTVPHKRSSAPPPAGDYPAPITGPGEQTTRLTPSAPAATPAEPGEPTTRSAPVPAAEDEPTVVITPEAGAPTTGRTRAGERAAAPEPLGGEPRTSPEPVIPPAAHGPVTPADAAGDAGRAPADAGDGAACAGDGATGAEGGDAGAARAGSAPNSADAGDGDGAVGVGDGATGAEGGNTGAARAASAPNSAHAGGGDGAVGVGERAAGVEGGNTGAAHAGSAPDSPDAGDGGAAAGGATDGGGGAAGEEPGPVPALAPPWKRLSSAGALICVLLALFGFTLVVQLRSNDTDEGLASARQEDLVRILSDLEARDTRLQAEIAALETSQRRLTSGVAGRQAALAEAEKRADELGLLAGTLAGRGPGLEIRISGVKASAILNAVQELRGAGGEVMELTGTNGGAVRVVASTYFVDAAGGGVVVDGTRLGGPYTLWVIGPAQTMQTALEIPGGVVAAVRSGGGSVTMEQHTEVDVTTVRKATSLQYARPVP